MNAKRPPRDAGVADGAGTGLRRRRPPTDIVNQVENLFQSKIVGYRVERRAAPPKGASGSVVQAVAAVARARIVETSSIRAKTMGNCSRSPEWAGAEAVSDRIEQHEIEPRGGEQREIGKPAAGKAPSALPRAEHSARDLLGGARQAVIHHEGRRYLLSLTRANKLILTRDEEAGGPG
jgi:hemin uptake protein HemP